MLAYHIEESNQLTTSFAREERAGLRLAVKGRTAALIVVAVLISVLSTFPSVLYYHALIAGFILAGYLHLWMQAQTWHRLWHDYAMVAADFILLTFALIYPNPFHQVGHPPQLTLKFGNDVYLYIMLAGLVFSFRPWLVLWGGVVGALSWALGVLYLASLPGARVVGFGNVPTPEHLALISDPSTVDVGVAIQGIVVFLIVSAMLAVIVRRSQALVLRQARAAFERSNLARYFAPNVVDRLASQDRAWASVQEQNAALMFVDIVGFTAWSERHPPTAVINLLRDIHAMLEDAIFRHQGSVDKYIGDGLFAVFGAPDPRPEDARNAVACACAILDDVAGWNAAREQDGLESIPISIGLHYGPIVVGDVGTERRLELAILGDTVNVASRLEEMTRAHGCRAILSDRVVKKAAKQGALPDALSGFARREHCPIRGRSGTIAIWSG